jgi:AcrR family transcriptional regulator
LQALADAYFDYYTNAQDYFRLMMAFDRGRFQEAIKTEIYEQILSKSLDALQLVIRAVKQGMTDGNLAAADPQQTAGQLWAAINGVLVMYSHPLRREILAHEVREMYVGVLHTMLKGMMTDDRR